MTTLLLLAASIVPGLACEHGQRPQVKQAVAQADYKPVIGTYGGRLVRATLGEPKSFNPVTAGETSTTVYTDLMFLGLTKSNPWTNQVEPELATSWAHDKSGKVWTVKLRKGVLWSDGMPFTADDVVFTYDTIYNKNVRAPMRDIISGPKGEQWKVEKIDDHTVRFTLPTVNAIFPQLIGTSIIPKHKYEAAVKADTFNSAMGTDADLPAIPVTGPFMLERYESGSRVFMKRNPHYYRKDAAGNRLPYLDSIVTLIVPNLDVQSLEFLQGQTDVIGIEGSDFPNFARPRKNSDFTIYKLGPNFGDSFLVFNQNPGVNRLTHKPYVVPYKLKWFQNERFRQAISSAIDRRFIVDSVLNGLGQPQYGPYSAHPKLFMSDPNIVKYKYDLARAKKMLAQIGMVDRDGDGVLEDAQGHKVAFNLTTNSENPQRIKIATVIRQDLEKLGIQVNFRPMTFNTLINKLDNTFDWEACVLGLTGGPEPAWGGNVWKSTGGLHMWYPNQPKGKPATAWEAKIDKLFADGITTLDPKKRRQIYFEWQQIISREQPFIYTVVGDNIVGLRNRFGNVFPTPLGGVLWNLAEIYVRKEKQ